MGPSERREAEWLIICEQRKVVAENLADHFDVSTKTIYRDFAVLMETRPIEHFHGRKCGGYKLLDDFKPQSRALSYAQAEVLKRLSGLVDPADGKVLLSILYQFMP